MSIRSMALRTARRLPPRHLAQVHAKEQAQGDMLGLELAAARLPQQLRATRRALLRARRVQVRVRVPVAFELPARQCGTQTATSMCDANPSRTRVCDCACILRSVLAHASVHSSSFKRANVTQLLRNTTRKAVGSANGLQLKGPPVQLWVQPHRLAEPLAERAVSAMAELGTCRAVEWRALAQRKCGANPKRTI